MNILCPSSMDILNSVDRVLPSQVFSVDPRLTAPLLKEVNTVFLFYTRVIHVDVGI